MMELRQSTTTSQLTLRSVEHDISHSDPVTLSFFSHGKILRNYYNTHCINLNENLLLYIHCTQYIIHYCYKQQLHLQGQL